MRLQMVHVYRMPLCCLLGSNTCQTSQNLHHFYAKAWHFEHLLHCMSFKRVPKPWVPLYIVHFLNILRAVCSWYLLPSCMVKLLILFPKEKLSRSMCKHSTWRPFKCAHGYCVCKADRFENGSWYQDGEQKWHMLLLAWNRAWALTVILMQVFLNLVRKPITNQYKKIFLGRSGNVHVFLLLMIETQHASTKSPTEPF